jgi:hypothetical protein
MFITTICEMNKNTAFANKYHFTHTLGTALDPYRKLNRHFKTTEGSSGQPITAVLWRQDDNRNKILYAISVRKKEQSKSFCDRVSAASRKGITWNPYCQYLQWTASNQQPANRRQVLLYSLGYSITPSQPPRVQGVWNYVIRPVLSKERSAGISSVAFGLISRSKLKTLVLTNIQFLTKNNEEFLTEIMHKCNNVNSEYFVITGEIWVSHGDEFEDSCLLGCWAV